MGQLLRLRRTTTFADQAKVVCRLQAHIGHLKDIHRQDILKLAKRVLMAADLNLIAAVDAHDEEDGSMTIQFRVLDH